VAELADKARAYLEQRGIAPEIATVAGLRAAPDDERVWFPWFDAGDNKLYESGRAINGAEPRWWQKGLKPALYATPSAWDAVVVAVVEGQLDALACLQAGWCAFATTTSHLTDEGAEILASMQQVILAFDDDDAGRKLTEQVIDMLAGRVELLVAEIPEGFKDPSDVAERSDDPSEAVAEALAAAGPVEVPWRTSWGPDTSEGIDAAPEVMARSDGARLFYLGKLHWLAGEPESGKTFLALAAVAEVLRGGAVALFLDFEDSRTSVVGRLEAMGVHTSKLLYVRPSEPLEEQAVADVERLMAMGPSLVVLDGIAEAMALHGLDPVRSPDVATFVHEVLDKFRSPTVTTVVIDHVARGEAGKGRYAYGSQHKLAAVDGASYRFETIQMFSRERGGAARIDVAKDRPGYVRSFALDKQRAGVLRVVPGDVLEVFVEPPTEIADDDLSYTERRVLNVLEDEGHSEGLTYKDIGDRLASDGKGSPLKRATIQKALDELAEQGMVDGIQTEGRHPSRFWKVENEPPQSGS
jgi:5S rRNA maturation endonuclease (ribonuclease M5)